MYPLLSERVLTLSTGVYAGFAVTISLVCVPAIKSSSDPLPVWKTTYNRGKNTALALIGVSTLASVNCYFNNNNMRFLCVSGLASAVPLFTLLCMKRTNDQLFSLSNDDKDVKPLIKKWAQLQWVRTTIGVSTFLFNLYLI